MDPRSLAREIRVECADDNPRMMGLQVMQADKMLAIESQERPPQTDGIGQHDLIFDCLRSFSSLQYGQYIVPPSSQLFHNRLGEVLIGIQFGQGSSILVIANLKFDFPSVRPHVRPRLDEVFGPQCWIAAQEIGFTDPESAGLFQNPDGNPSADDTRLTAADPRSTLDPRKRIPQIMEHRLNQLSFFSSSESRQQRFCLFKRSRHLIPRLAIIDSFTSSNGTDHFILT